MPKIIHAGENGIALCGSFEGDIIDVDEAFDPECKKYFTCGACWKVFSNNVEPMGGSLYLSEAHGAGAE